MLLTRKSKRVGDRSGGNTDYQKLLYTSLLTLEQMHGRTT